MCYYYEEIHNNNFGPQLPLGIGFGVIMLASFLLSLREGLEAALIIGVLLGTLRKLAQPEYRKTVWFGVSLAILVSGLTGFALNILGARFEGSAEKIFEGITMLLAAVILTWVVLWMSRQPRDISERLESDIKIAVSNRSRLALFSLSFLAVIREGIELAFFLTAVSLDTDGFRLLLGAGLGLAVVVMISFLLFRGLIKLKLARFFQVTSFILVIFAAGLVAHGVHEFNEVGLISPIIENLWDINFVLDEKSILGVVLKTLVGYNGNPSLSEVMAYLLYFVIISVVGFRINVKNNKTSLLRRISNE